MIQDKIVSNRSGLHFYLDGQEVSEAAYRQRHPLPADESATPFVGSVSCSAWPILSDAMAVHPSQITEAVADAKRKGIDIDFEPEAGRPVFRDRDHRKRYMRAYGVHDNNGGYGD